MANVTFLFPHALWALFSIPLIIAMHFFLLKYTRRKALIFGNFEAMKRVTGEIVLSKNILLLIMRIVILMLLILSASGMTVWYAGRTTNFNYALAIDASSSMLADDFAPSRLVAAKETARTFAEGLSANAFIGVIAFSGTSFVQQHLTDDIDLVSASIENIGVSEVGGTDLGEAIVTATNMLISDDKPGVVILLTDGQSTVGTPIEDGVSFARENRVTIYTIGMATEAGGRFTNLPLVSTVDEESLSYIADNTGGNYFPATSKETLLSAFTEISTSEETQLPLHLSLTLLIIGLLLLFAEWALINTKYRTLP